MIALAYAYLAGLIGASSFFIDRADANCRTPRRNPDTQRVLDEFHQLANWSQAVIDYFNQQPLTRETNMEWAPEFGTKYSKPIGSLSVSDASCAPHESDSLSITCTKLHPTGQRRHFQASLASFRADQSGRWRGLYLAWGRRH